MQTTGLQVLRHYVHFLKTVKKNLHSEFSRLTLPSFLFKYVIFFFFFVECLLISRQQSHVSYCFLLNVQLIVVESFFFFSCKYTRDISFFCTDCMCF